MSLCHWEILYWARYISFEQEEGVYIMSKKNSISPTKVQLQSLKTNKRLTYSQPQFYSLGSLEQVQGGYQGSICDGSGQGYYYQ